MARFKIFILAACMLGLTTLVHAADPAVGPGKKVNFDYTLTVDGKELETSKGKAPLVVVFGAKQIVPGLESAMNGMHVGEEKMVKVAPKDAYGEPDPKAYLEFPKTSLPAGQEPKVGATLQAHAPDGSTFPAVIKEIKGDKIVVDFNHPLAGKTLQFKVKVVKIEDAPVAATKG